MFFNLTNSREKRESDETSYYNNSEAEFVTACYDLFEAWHGTKLNIGIITPYKRQVIALRKILAHFFVNRYKIDIEVNTVDGF